MNDIVHFGRIITRYEQERTDYVAQLERRVAFLEARITELARMQPPAPIYLEVPAELRAALIEHLHNIGVKSE